MLRWGDAAHLCFSRCTRCLRQRERERRAFHARDLPGAETLEPSHEILVRLLWERRWPSETIPSTASERRAPFVPGFELANHSLGLVVEVGDDLAGVLFRVVKSQAADREIDDVMTVPRSRPG